MVEVKFIHSEGTKQVRVVRVEPPVPPYEEDNLGAVVAALVGGEQPPKPYLTHPKGVTEGKKGYLYPGCKKGNTSGNYAKDLVAMQQLGQLP